MSRIDGNRVGNAVAALAPQSLKSRPDFVYVNAGYLGSAANVNARLPLEPPTSVVREQYWACSKWPFAQQILAVTVGVLLGAVIGLVLALFMKSDDKSIGDIFRTARTVPD